MIARFLHGVWRVGKHEDFLKYEMPRYLYIYSLVCVPEERERFLYFVCNPFECVFFSIGHSGSMSHSSVVQCNQQHEITGG